MLIFRHFATEMAFFLLFATKSPFLLSFSFLKYRP